jgi:hypothetical protein
MLAKLEKQNTILPKAGNDGICPHCNKPTRFLHVEQYPGDGPFMAYQEPLEKQRTPIVQVRKMKCTRQECGQMIITLDSPKWSGTIIPYQQIKTN